MRAYYFGNFYLSSIQQGIQAGHVTHELFVKYPDRHIPASQGDRLWEWAEHHKTMILLNGGMASRLMDTEHFLKDEDNPYPWTSCLLYTSPSPRDKRQSRMPSSA